MTLFTLACIPTFFALAAWVVGFTVQTIFPRLRSLK